jgi:glycerophosphoryl diester phosphodiesterase
MASPLVIAHRGASAAHPEKTVAAFRGARALGADWVELDVRRTADLALAVHHDEALADGRLIVSVEASMGDWPADVPLLDAALDACEGMGVNIEIKNWPLDSDFDPDRWLSDAVVSLLAARGRKDEVLVSSFDLETVDRVRGLDPSVPTAFLVMELDDPARVVAATARRGHAALHPWAPAVDAELIDRCHDAGLKVNAWTVDDPDWMARLAEMGVDGIVTNVPDVARRAVGTGF